MDRQALALCVQHQVPKYGLYVTLSEVLSADGGLGCTAPRHLLSASPTAQKEKVQEVGKRVEMVGSPHVLGAHFLGYWGSSRLSQLPFLQGTRYYGLIWSKAQNDWGKPGCRLHETTVLPVAQISSKA